MIIKSTEIRVVILEPVSSIRSMISHVLRDMGCKDILAVGSSKDLLRVLESENVDWILSRPLLNEKVNILHILKLLTQEESLFSIKTTIMMDPETDTAVLSSAFQHGLLSYVEYKTNYNDLLAEFQDMANICKRELYDHVMISAFYIRKYCFENNAYPSLVSYERNLLHYYPGREALLLNLGETLLKSNKEKDAKTLLNQLFLIDEGLSSDIDKLCERYNTKFKVEGLKKSKWNLFNIKKVMIIDSDSDVVSNLKDLLESVGVTNIESYESADSASVIFGKSDEPGLIISEWDVPGVIGSILVQRIRHSGWWQVPIFILSYKVKVSDFEFLKEFGVNSVLAKPFSNASFLRKLTFLLQEERQPSEQANYESKIIKLTRKGRVHDAERLLLNVNKDSKIKKCYKIRMSAFVKFAKKDYQKCIESCETVLAQMPKDALTLHLMGKAYLQSHKPIKALSCFEEAAESSPHNIERLLLMSDIENTMENAEKSEKHLSEASKIDNKSILVKITKCKRALEAGDRKKSKDLAQDLDNYTAVVSSINNYAISLVYANRLEEAINLYQKSLLILPDGEIESTRLISYNLALGFIKNNDLKSGVKVLTALHSSNDKSHLDKKIISLLQKSKKALKNNEEVILNQQESFAVKETNSKTLSRLNPTDLCSYLIFFDVNGLGAKFEPSNLEELIRFSPKSDAA